MFTIFPAIDLRNGRVVRLQHGDPNQQTVFSDDPVAMAEKWLAAGAIWLHVVNLDGAFDEAGAANWAMLPHLTALPVKVQFGGGVRTLDDIERVIEAGAARVILGTTAIEKPALLGQAVAHFGAKRIVVGIDARDGRVQARGWLQDTAVTPIELGKKMRALGVKTAIYTDINRDGALAGVNVVTTAELAQATGLQVIASGGVATLDDVRRCLELADQGVTGVIMGRAIYDGRVNLQEAIALTQVNE
ncbi:MAG: 1-(5-phosphoribosyl)-5-[(5-phosphoribosylamino)methylideneamino]imidazole-4-carboxamide isomerase [Chloroflexi bacterium]|nr:1-(5-phosphoribosyl)-5-[(5-phosphoribosylamino)methylideneamino]imidazole-4-carboxamide isomerase [Ardenticatenaceae bacterium]MBL1131362.1 1-(5-phosphoribosyl)-5-[(5-phosphoribosylamino)methylideneamino]imidazole-4-carboxamide isomerase [Chloroflexota bacterium]NOG37464.1 1-(5-phosphoribosyl)-5-[(5-phosphoribosylamino)methylideneamino]imidazole-4-carboxamide isomerase [Chloroflexota bacterium]